MVADRWRDLWRSSTASDNPPAKPGLPIVSRSKRHARASYAAPIPRATGWATTSTARVDPTGRHAPLDLDEIAYHRLVSRDGPRGSSRGPRSAGRQDTQPVRTQSRTYTASRPSSSGSLTGITCVPEVRLRCVVLVQKASGFLALGGTVGRAVIVGVVRAVIVGVVVRIAFDVDAVQNGPQDVCAC